MWKRFLVEWSKILEKVEAENKEKIDAENADEKESE